MSKQQYNITVSGRVQGVGFRYSTQQKAWQIGLTGFVRNLPNGDVYIEAEGTTEQLQLFVAWCRQGPSRAHVENVYVQPSPPSGYRDFDIR